MAGLLAVAAWGVTKLLPSLREERADSAEDILRERFARGEISAEEFQRSVEILRGVTVRGTRDANWEDG